LEVVVALTILVAALGVMGAQLVAGLRLMGEADQQARAAALADRLLTMVEFDPELEEVIAQEKRMDGDFGLAYPGWFWELEFEPLETEGEFVEEQVPLSQVHVRVLHQEDRERADDSAGAKLVREVVLLKAPRPKINLVEDFGMSQEQAEQLGAALPVGDLDLLALDPQVLVTLATQDPQTFLTLLEPLLPLIRQYFGAALSGQAGQFLQGGGPTGQAAAGEQAGTGGEGEMSIDDLLRLEQELIGGQGGAGQGGRTGRPGAAGAPGQRRTPPGGGAGRGAGGRGGAGSGRNLPGPSGVGPDGQPRYTIEDLMRLRDALTNQERGR